jgi:hypothetical protein
MSVDSFVEELLALSRRESSEIGGKASRHFEND